MRELRKPSTLRPSTLSMLWLAGVFTLTPGCGLGPQEPSLSAYSQSATVLSGGEEVRLAVSHESTTPVTIRWSATAGTLGGTYSEAASSITWQAPYCIPEGAPLPVVTATLTDEKGRSASAAFHFQEAALFRCVVSESAPMRRPRVGHTATLLTSGKVLVVGGVSGFATLQSPSYSSAVPSVFESSAELYDPSTGTWAPTGALNRPRTGHQAHLLPSGKVLVVSGGWRRLEGSFDLEAITTLELYEPSTGTWTAVSEWAGDIRSVKSSVLLASGKVLVLGRDETGYLRSALYDPEANTWRPATSPSGDFSMEDVIRLRSGRVLAVGTRHIRGADGYSRPSPGAWRYDPGTDTWALTGPMQAAESFFDTSLSLLPSGEVLCLYDLQGQVTAELYRPETDTWVRTASPPVNNPTSFDASPVPSGPVIFTSTDLDWRLNVFDAATASWRMAGHLPGRLPWGGTVTPLPSGQALLVGGQLRVEFPLSVTPQGTTWLYGPRSP